MNLDINEWPNTLYYKLTVYENIITEIKLNTLFFFAKIV